MALTLNQFLLLVITFAIVVAVTVFIILLVQLRRTAREGEETLRELRELVQNLKDTNLKVSAKIDDLGDIVEASKKTAKGLSEIAWFLSTKIIRPPSKYWPFIFPLIRLGWRKFRKKKRKEE